MSNVMYNIQVKELRAARTNNACYYLYLPEVFTNFSVGDLWRNVNDSIEFAYKQHGHSNIFSTNLNETT